MQHGCWLLSQLGTVAYCDIKCSVCPMLCSWLININQLLKGLSKLVRYMHTQLMSLTMSYIALEKISD